MRTEDWGLRTEDWELGNGEGGGGVEIWEIGAKPMPGKDLPGITRRGSSLGRAEGYPGCSPLKASALAEAANKCE